MDGGVTGRCGSTVHRSSTSNGGRARLDRPVVIVLEGHARAGVDEAIVDGVEVVHAPGEADDAIVAFAEEHSGVVVVTADRGLAERVTAAGADVIGPSGLLDQLVE